VQDGTQLQPNIGLDRVGADYFKTLGIPLIAGRDISEQDRADTSGVVVINDALAARFFRDRNPLGLRIRTVDTDGSVRPYEIVGVAADAHTQSPRGSVEPRFFVPAEQRLSLENHRTFLIRTAPGVAGMVPAVQRAVAAVDPAIALDDLSDAESQLRALTAEERVMARLASFFGIVSVLLAAVGLYGVLSYGVARRAGEIGVRIALGAEPRGVVGMILRDSMGMLATGLFGGGVLALLASRLLSARLYGLADHDPFTFLFAAVVLVMAAAAAAYLPARRASSVDPLVVLRQE
jgi:ABC-type antimicrobial peptide transport system permease subunit